MFVLTQVISVGPKATQFIPGFYSVDRTICAHKGSIFSFKKMNGFGKSETKNILCSFGDISFFFAKVLISRFLSKKVSKLRLKFLISLHPNFASCSLNTFATDSKRYKI